MRAEYRIGDAIEELRTLPDDLAAVVCLDDAWARPKRGDEFGVNYPTHGFETTTAIIEECHRVLKPGGWLIADTDDWLLPKLLDYLRAEWGNAAADYRAGYRKVGGVTYTRADGAPDRSTPGQKGATGGYSVVFAHKGETERRWSESVRQMAQRPRERYGWGSVKPTGPYQTWVEAITDPGETVIVPCAGTAPAAIAAERIGREWIAIDSEPAAREAYQRRRTDEFQNEQTTLTAAADGGSNTDSDHYE